ncbi:MAG: Flavin reductase like domain protein [Syntrophorhabdaceae bacterium PtaU1.Bin034]|nr:MAG: Flavin reductase like domain protein [Syntrophorhabdaceae bacterium PtaU1.Bin034]
MNELPLSKAFQLIEPGPVVLVTTAHKKKANVMAMSWHMVMDFTPQIGCIIGPWDYSFSALRTTKECVIAIPTVDMAGKVVDIGNCSGQDVDKFKAFKLTALPAENVKAPLIAECLAHIECRVVDESLADKYNRSSLRGSRPGSTLTGKSAGRSMRTATGPSRLMAGHSISARK